jgi:tripartite-type tricarboxylate transporter receptor subunit TctC
MKRKIRMFLVMIGVGLIVSVAPSITTADEFFKGKTIRFIVGAPAGGGYDT